MAGIVFSVLLVVATVLQNLAIPDELAEGGEWVDDEGNRAAFIVALNLLPFAGIAFLWFIAVIRDRVGEREDRFYSTVFLGSGVLFVAMLFATGAVSSGLVLAAATADLSDELWTFGRAVDRDLLGVYAMRMAAVFAISTTTIVTRLGLAPRWLTVLGFATGIVLLLTAGILPWVELLFPVWVFTLSVYTLIMSFRSSAPAGDPPKP